MTTYISIMGMCFILTAVLFLCNYKNWRFKKWRPVFFAYILLMVSTLSDAFWGMINRNPDFISLNYFVVMVEFSTFGWIGYCWFCYCSNYDFYPFMKKVRIKLLAAIPMVIITVLIFTTHLTGLLFTIDGNAVYHRGPAFILQQTAYVYLLIATIIAVRSWSVSEFQNERKHLFTMVAFIFFPALLGGLQLMFPPCDVPTMQFAILLSLILQFADEQERKITHDSLTNLVNRFEFERLLEDSLTHWKKSNPYSLYILMGDIDQFKLVNDTMGHLQGDRVLQDIAAILYRSVKHLDAVAARVSGDEFCILMNAADDTEIEKFISGIDTKLKEYSKDFPFPIALSLGYVKYDGRMSSSEILSEVDLNMYRVKREKISLN